MSFVKLPRSSDRDINSGAPVRPKFNHQNTVDRLREGSSRPVSFSSGPGFKKDRKSMFKEVGLDDDHDDASESVTETPIAKRPDELPGQGPANRAASYIRTSEQVHTRRDENRSPQDSPISPQSPQGKNKPWYSKLSGPRRPRIQPASSVTPPPNMSNLPRLTMIALLIAIILPAFSYYNGQGKVALNGADAGAIPPRQNSPTQICNRWSHQTAMLNGTLYIYGGQATTSTDQVNNTWNNDFLTLDLTKSWSISSPALTGLPQPSGPPAVANGYLWNDYNNLYLYGGEFADNPFVDPVAVATWMYSISSQTWTEFSSPQTSSGNNSDAGGVPVQRAAEGAGLSVPELGLSWYFGGHVDVSTTPGWSNQIDRVYLKSLLEFTNPGYTNDGVYSLTGGNGAGSGGVYRNITQGGLQTDSGFSERADGVLVFVPGWGEKGVLIGLAGGTNDSFTEDLSTLDVYDIANSEWYHQQTTGTIPSVRVNPCAVVASAPDASSFEIYLYGGQNLLPHGNQTQYDDMYILSIPAFTWIQATQGGTNIPAARAGHTCNLRDGQIVVVGGYVGAAEVCDSPGIYVFNATSLEWQSSFTALDHVADLDPDNSVQAGSYGYSVPEAVAGVIGGNSAGSATATTPAVGPATGGPFATGKSPVFTVTDSGSTATVTRWGPDSTGSGSASAAGSGSSSPAVSGSSTSHTDASVVAAGVIAALAGVAAGYLGFCAWLYRRQVRAYRSHLAVANRYGGGAGPNASHNTVAGGLAAFFGRKGSKESRKSGAPRAGGVGLLSEKTASGGIAGHRRNESSSTNDSFAWVGQPATEPRMLFDDPTPASGTSGSSGLLLQQPTLQSQRPSPEASGGYSGSGASGTRWTDERGSYSGLAGPNSSGSGVVAGVPMRSWTPSNASSASTENLLAGQEPSFFSVVMGPRRALRVVNGMEGEQQ